MPSLGSAPSSPRCALAPSPRRRRGLRLRGPQMPKAPLCLVQERGLWGCPLGFAWECFYSGGNPLLRYVSMPCRPMPGPLNRLESRYIFGAFAEHASHPKTV
jgi:hypothetical protein